MKVYFEPAKGIDEKRHGFTPFMVEMPMPPDEGWTIEFGRVDKFIVLGKPELSVTHYWVDEQTSSHTEFEATVTLFPHVTRRSY